MQKTTIKLAITGSNGYVGNFLSAYFSDKSIAVVGIDLFSDKRQQSFSNFTFKCGDVRDKTRLKSIFEEEKITHVIHLAYVMDPLHDRKREDDIDVNGSIAVFRAAHGTKSVTQFIHFSSTSAYGAFKDNLLWITEEQPLRPRDWVYAQNKKRVEEFYNNFVKRKDFKLVNLRMCTAVGKSYYKQGGVIKTLHASPIGLFLDSKDTFIQFIHEDDVKTLVERIIRDNKITGTFNLAADSYATTRQLNQKKLFIPFPKRLFKIIIVLLWHLRLISVSPTSVNLVAHGIIVSPKKLMNRYNYRFLYSTKSAYDATVNARIENGTL